MTRVVVESSDLPLSQKDRIEFTWEDREYLLVKDYLYRLCSHNEEARSFILGDFVVGDGSLYLYAKASVPLFLVSLLRHLNATVICCALLITHVAWEPNVQF